MQKRLSIVLCLMLIGLLLTSFVSAFSFKDFFKNIINKMTGKVIDANLQPVYRCYDPRTGNHILSRYANCDPAYPTYWTSEGLIGYLFKTEQTETYRLDRCWSELRKEHFTSKDCTAEGGALNDVLGYAYSSQKTNTHAVYRCYWKEKNEYFDSLNSNCEGHIVNSTLGWFLTSNVIPDVVCGDGSCNGNENCSTCAVDCGECECTPSCTGKCGGSNGCGGTCANTCSGTTPYCYNNTQCIQCLTNVNCPTGKTCNANHQCVASCTPNCVGKVCGDNGCGGSCGSCPIRQTCSNGKCSTTCTNECTSGTKRCNPTNLNYNQTCGNYDTDTCTEWNTGSLCANGCENGICKGCTPNCTGKCGGSNGCGGTCSNTCSGTTPYCYNNTQCVQCLTNSNCLAGQTCNANHQCVASCIPNCVGKVCGDNGCGGTCGSCETGKTCDANGQCISQVAETQAVYRCYDPRTGNHMLSRYSNCDPAYPDYWTSEGLMGYLYKQEQSSTYRLDRCWSELRKEHFTSKDCTAEGGTLNDVLGYAYSSQNTNTSSVYRCYWKEKNEYFDSLNSNCEGHIVNSTLGWFLKSGSSCTPSCTGKCGGSNGCSGTCANTCSGTTPYCYHNVSCVQCLTNINCPTGQTCSNGVCPQTNPQNNIKNMNLYSSKEAFLISDKNWKDVLPLVPLTTWTQQQGDTSPCQRGYGTPENVCVYPTLIYHEETTGFDADSIIYFFQQYTPSRVSIIGTTPQELNNLLIAQPELGAGLTQDKVQRININNYLSYWQEYESVVYVEDNYELALMASTYASLINAPLIIKGSTLDTDVSFANRKVICVGSVTRTCNENYNLEQLQKKYVEMTNTDKIILVNPNDLNIKVTEQFQPEKSAGPISEIYSKTSLASPILASAKHEVILSIELDTLGEGVDEETIRVNVIKIDDFIGEKIGGWNIDEGYLTILATPDAIESRFYQKVYDLYWLINADTARYSSHDEDTILEFATGRIFGISISDISSYISRDLFNHIINSGDKIFLLAGDFAPEIAETMVYSQKIYPLYQYSTEDFIEYEGCCPYVSPDMYKNKFFVQYRDHGNHNWLGISSTQLPKLDNTFFVTSACSTCIYYDYKKPELFCVQALRKGALGYIGMHVGGGPFINYQYLISAFSNNISVGKAWNGALMSQYSSIEEGADDPSNGVGLLGDPTINLHSFSNRLPQSELVKLDNENYLLNLKVMKIPVEFSYKGNELATDTFISSSFINSDAFIYTFKSFYPPPGIEEVHVNGLIKIGPVEKGYNRVKFFDDHIYSRIYERESLNNEQEILWITFSPYSEFFNYDISEPSSDFQDYPFKFKIEK